MYERFTDRARKVMQLANERARRLNQQYIGPDHILLGLLMVGGGIGVEALRNLGVNLLELESTLESLLERGAGPVPAYRRLPPLPGAQKVMEDAITECRNLKHLAVDTEHILLALLQAKDGYAAVLLLNRNVKLHDVREEIERCVNGGRTRAASTPPRRKETEDLPIELRIPSADLDAELRRLNSAKGEAVESQDFEQAAALRDEGEKLRRKRKALLKDWIGRCQIDLVWLSANAGAALALARQIADQRSWNLLPELAALL